MCLITDNVEQITSTSNIVVYKTGKMSGVCFYPSYQSNFKYFPFLKNKKQKLCPRYAMDAHIIIMGYHSWINKDNCGSYSYIFVIPKNTPHIKGWWDEVFPKGTPYTQIVSENLVFIGENNKWGQFKLKIYNFITNLL